MCVGGARVYKGLSAEQSGRPGHSVPLSPKLKVAWTWVGPDHASLYIPPNQATTYSRKALREMPRHLTTPLCSQLTPLCRTSFSSELTPPGSITIVWCAAEAKINFTHTEKKFGSVSINDLNHTGWEHWPGPGLPRSKLGGLLRRGIHARLSQVNPCFSRGVEGWVRLLDPWKPLSEVPQNMETESSI